LGNFTMETELLGIYRVRSFLDAKRFP